VPLNRAESKTGEAQLSHRDRQLLGLLASGATDTVIARTFDWSIRTVQRHIHELMQTVGARTRFQIGMEATAAAGCDASESGCWRRLARIGRAVTSGWRLTRLRASTC
jgi:DNA-binding NarL/FixJ family response regulator